jgi:hypothetical protein
MGGVDGWWINSAPRQYAGVLDARHCAYKIERRQWGRRENTGRKSE